MALLVLAKAVYASLVPRRSRDKGSVHVEIRAGEAYASSRRSTKPLHTVVGLARVVVFPAGGVSSAWDRKKCHANPEQDEPSEQ